MDFKYRFLLSIITSLKTMLYWRVKSTLSSQNLDQTSKGTPLLDKTIPTFYVTRYRSLTDSLVLQQECQKADLPLPFDPFLSNQLTLPSDEISGLKDQHLKSDAESPSKLKFWNRLIPLTRPGITELSTKSPRYFSNKLQLLIDRTLTDPDFHVQLVPASVFWGRSPRTEGSFWNAAFSDSWSIPGFFRKFIMVLSKGRQTYVHIGRPFLLRQIIERESEPQRALAKTHRLIRRRMKMQREAFIGPDLSHRRTLLLSILETPGIKAKIEKQAIAENKPVEKIRQKAFLYANEIAADYSHSVITALHVLLRWLWTRLYDGVKIYGGPKLQHLAQEHAIVYVPSHRSHIDYLLLSYVLYGELDLVPPHIAAGVNLNLPIIGPILRRGGAFFMRRSFKDNPLYAAIFSEYLHRVLDRGFSIEYFIEGGRSRTGRQLPPKPGMLSMTLQSYSSSAQRSLVFVPVNFCYERLFEGKSYLGELRGQAKRKESLTQFIKSLKRIKQNFGQVHVTFGEPIAAASFLASQNLASSQDYLNLSYVGQKNVSLELGQLISKRINAAAHVHAIALVSVALEASAKHAIEEELLEEFLKLLKDYLITEPYSEGTEITTLSPKDIVLYAQKLDYICRYPNQFGDILFATEKQAQFLSYFRNNVLHYFVLPSLLALLFYNRRNITEAELVFQAKELYPFLQAELFLQWNPEDIEQPLLNTISFLKKNKLLWSNTQPKRLELLAGIVRSSLERFAIVLTLLERAGSGMLTAKELEIQARIHAERVSRLYQINSPEYFDSKLFNNLVAQLFNNQLVQINEDGKLIFDENLHSASRKTEVILGTNLHNTLWTQKA